jgi:tripartite-type tricarboxylate transporter receptor subunit TctC
MIALLRFALSGWFALSLGIATAADTYPTKPIRVIVPYPPGGATDSIVRVVAEKLSQNLGQPVIVDNRPGAGTIVATEAATKAAPDGYTLLIVTAAFTFNPSLVAKLPYNSETAFAPVSMIGLGPNILTVNASLPVSSVKELIEYAKSNPNKVNYGSAGNGTSTHIAGEMFRTMAGIDIAHVPYKGDGPAIIDLLGGRIQMLFVGGLGAIEQHIKAGKVKALAVTTATRSPLAPDLPTVASDLPGFESAVWNGVVVPAGTPPDIINRLHSEIAKVVAQPDTRKRIIDIGYQPMGNTPAEFGDYLRAETQRVAKIVQTAGIRLE